MDALLGRQHTAPRDGGGPLSAVGDGGGPLGAAADAAATSATAAGSASGSAPGILRLDGIVKTFGDVRAVDGLSLSLNRGEFVTLLGPSGCGKTTALRIIAGFERPDEGSVRFRDEPVTDWSPQRRGFGMVFQNYALFPHLDVFENVAFGLRSRKQSGDEIRRKVAAALERVDLPGYADRAVQALSGGQQQRVALARALAIEPPLLLLDEPLSNLDAALRERTRKELRLLVKELGITALFVTHDQEEAFDLSDRIAVMSAGRLRQFGSPRELYEEPADHFVASFMGRANAFRAVIEDGAMARLEAGARWPLQGAAGAENAAGAKNPAATTTPETLLLVRPEDLLFVNAEQEGALPGRLRDRRFGGAHTTYFVDVEGAGIVEVVSDAAGPRVGETVHLHPRPGARLHRFPREHA